MCTNYLNYRFTLRLHLGYNMAVVYLVRLYKFGVKPARLRRVVAQCAERLTIFVNQLWSKKSGYSSNTSCEKRLKVGIYFFVKLDTFCFLVLFYYSVTQRMLLNYIIIINLNNNNYFNKIFNCLFVVNKKQQMR